MAKPAAPLHPDYEWTVTYNKKYHKEVAFLFFTGPSPLPSLLQLSPLSNGKVTQLMGRLV